MKIEIGPGGKILGTKKVSANGQVSGLTEYAGQEVIVILPGEEGVETGATNEEMFIELQKAALDHMKIAFKQYDELQNVFVSPNEAAREFMKKVAPTTFQNFIDQANTWVKEQATNAEKQFEETLNETVKKRKKAVEGK